MRYTRSLANPDDVYALLPAPIEAPEVRPLLNQTRRLWRDLADLYRQADLDAGFTVDEANTRSSLRQSFWQTGTEESIRETKQRLITLRRRPWWRRLIRFPRLVLAHVRRGLPIRVAITVALLTLKPIHR